MLYILTCFHDLWVRLISVRFFVYMGSYVLDLLSFMREHAWLASL